MLRVGRPRCLLVVAPHPDDETIGAFGLIARCRRGGATIRILVVSDGGASHPSSPRWPRARLVAERRRETIWAARRSGVFREALTFLDLPDGAVSAAQALRFQLGRAIRQAPKPLIVAAPLATDDHADHRAVAGAIATVWVRGARVLGYPVWPAGGLRQPRSRAIVLSPRERLAKRHAIRSYRTQAGRITDDPSGFAMTAPQIAAFSRPIEWFVEGR